MYYVYTNKYTTTSTEDVIPPKIDQQFKVQIESQIKLTKVCNWNLPRTTLYNLGDEGWSRIFYNLAKQNERERMFEVAGKHTFFLPVDSAFEVATSFDNTSPQIGYMMYQQLYLSYTGFIYKVIVQTSH